MTTMMKKPRPSRLGLAATALVAALTLSSTANFASAINDYGGLRGNAIANSNGSTDIWGGEPGTDVLPASCFKCKNHIIERQLEQLECC